MAKTEVQQPEQLLPKDLLEDLESGDRSEQWLEISQSDSFESSVQQARAINDLANQAAGSSWAAATVMGGMSGGLGGARLRW